MNCGRVTRWGVRALATGFGAALVLGLGTAQAARTTTYAHASQAARSQPGGAGDQELYTMNADGSGQTNLTNDPGSEDSFATWSHDGTRIAWAQTSHESGDSEIFSMAADGSDRRD